MLSIIIVIASILSVCRWTPLVMLSVTVTEACGEFCGDLGMSY